MPGSRLQLQFALVNRVDTILFLKGLSDHSKRKIQVLRQLSDALAKIKHENRSFFTNMVDNFGHPVHFFKF